MAEQAKTAVVVRELAGGRPLDAQNAILRGLEPLVEELRAIMVERGWNARFEVIEGKWEMGECITHKLGYKKHGQEKIIAALAQELECSEENLYQCVKFYQMFPQGIETSHFTEGKNISWWRITQKYLGAEDGKGRGRKRVRFTVDEIAGAFKQWFVENESSVSQQEVDNFLKILRDGKYEK